ncbi:MAG: 5-formyltetrahydrofolate cyclo-ligase [Gammaproteobacteria bacterium]|nr:5-formyltetrahydrofolate cyclo-ligase [Gammaproteobacteria bacterium]
MDLRALRRELRALRRRLDEQQRGRFSQQVACHLANHPHFLAARHVACYLACDGELTLHPLMERAWAMGKAVYLPVLGSSHRNNLDFLPYQRGDTLVPNRFGIPEPEVNSRRFVAATRLDLVLMPLVGFDAQGHRLGMGGGFYDRSFAFLKSRRHWRKPRLLGVGFGVQECLRLPRQRWDVPLDGVVTEAGVRRFSLSP